MSLDIAFWILAVVCAGAALAVVLIQDVFRAALFLVLCFFTVAGIFITLQADFLAVVQVLVYVGAVAVLLVFAIMLTRETQRGSPSNRLRIPVLIFALLLLGTMVFTIVDQPWNQESAAELTAGAGTTEAVAAKLFAENGFILPFEIAGVLLLAAVIGAIVIMRERK